MWKDSEWAVQQGSYINPVVPPATDACDPPTVSVCINQAWIPYICGALSQLAQPTTWIVGSRAELLDVLDRVADLISAIGTAMPCTSPPPILGTSSTPQRACNIAGYLANVLIKDSITKAIESLQQNQTLLGYGALIVQAIPGAGVVINLIAKALYGLYSAVESGTLADYAEGVADPTLWSKVTCAIYSATSGDGQVTDTNFPTILTNVAAVSYAHADVVTTITNYLSDLGASGLEQLQGTGAFAVYDCSSCGTGISTGPGGLPIREQASSSSLTIAAGTASQTIAVSFSPAFLSAPVLTLQSQNPVLIASADSVTASGFNLTITAAVTVDVDTAAIVDWIASLQGSVS